MSAPEFTDMTDSVTPFFLHPLYFLSDFSHVFSDIMYLGLCFVSRYIFPMYSPRIPIEKSCIPLKKHKIHTIDAHPATVLCMITHTIAHITPINPKMLTITPKPAIREIGFTEKLVIPSNAK